MEEQVEKSMPKGKQTTRPNLVDDVSLAEVLAKRLVAQLHFPQLVQLVVEADNAPILSNHHETLLLLLP